MMLSSTETFDIKNSKPDGTCRLSVAKGFILTVFFVLLAVLVGIIVHFAGNGKGTICQCDCGSGVIKHGLDSSLQQLTTAVPDIDNCLSLASTGNAQICTILHRNSNSNMCMTVSSPHTNFS